MKKITFIVPPAVELLDLAGPVQVFTEAKFYGFDINIEFYAYQQEPISTAGLAFGKLTDYKKAKTILLEFGSVKKAAESVQKT